MAGSHGTTIRLTANFSANLEAIVAYWRRRAQPAAFARLLGDLEETIIPALERFPSMGTDLLRRRADSVEALVRSDKLRLRLEALGDAATVREYRHEDYLVLYVVANAAIHLLAIRHHQQLVSDL